MHASSKAHLDTLGYKGTFFFECTKLFQHFFIPTGLILINSASKNRSIHKKVPVLSNFLTKIKDFIISEKTLKYFAKNS